MVKYRDKEIKMSGKTNKYLGILAASALILANTAMSFADDELKSFSLKSNVNELDFLEKMRGELNLSKSDYRQVLNNIADTESRLAKVKEESMSLKEQLENLDLNIAETTETLVKVIKQVVEKENQVKLLHEDIEMKEIAIEYHKGLLADYIRIIYQQENDFLTLDAEGNVDAFKLLLSDGSVGENLRQMDYMNLLNEAGQQMVERLDQLSNELEGQQADLEKSRLVLSALQTELQDEKDQLDLQKKSKERLLKITSGQEEIYGQLLEQTLKEQEELVFDIRELNGAYELVKKIGRAHV